MTAVVEAGRSSVPGSRSRNTCPAHRLTTVASTSLPRQCSWYSCISTRPCVTENHASGQTLSIHWSVWRTKAVTSTVLDDWPMGMCTLRLRYWYIIKTHATNVHKHDSTMKRPWTFILTGRFTFTEYVLRRPYTDTFWSNPIRSDWKSGQCTLPVGSDLRKFRYV